MYGYNLSKKEDIERVIDNDNRKPPIKVGKEYVVVYPVEDKGNSIFFGETLEVLDVTDGGFSFQCKVFGSPNRIVVIPAAVAILVLSEDKDEV